MEVSKMGILPLLSISFGIWFMANSVTGACDRPNFMNPYAILLDPDDSTYAHYYYIDFSCKEAHTAFGLPDRTYCGDITQDTDWDPDPSGGRCEAQCNTDELLDDDILVEVNDTQQTLVDSQSTGYFHCRGPGQITGVSSALCENGTFDYGLSGIVPSCLAFCPVYLEELGDGLYYDVANEPAENETDTLYYRDGNEITYRCSDGYEDPINCNSSDCTSTCDDGTWDPPNIPTCVEIDECASNPCQNNATCDDNIDGYECHCPDGFNGTLCENDINDCANHTCENGATCIDKVASYECHCPEGFNGTYCEIDIDECSSNPCQNNATCADIVNGFNCTCLPGYSGDKCDQVMTTSAMTTAITMTDITTSPGPTSEPILTTDNLDVTTVELTTTMFMSTTMADQTTMATLTTEAITTEAMTNSLPFTPPSTTLMTTPDSSTTYVMTTETAVTTETPAATTVTSSATTTSPTATTETVVATTVTPDLETVTSTATTTPAPTTVTPVMTPPDSSTISVLTTETAVTTDTPDLTTITPVITTISEEITTLKTEKTLTSSRTTPRKTEESSTPALPCGGECQPTQVCNEDDKCECRPNYYEDEEDLDNPCKEPTSIDVTITITEVNGEQAEYIEEYADPESEEFQELETNVCLPFEEIYKSNPDYRGCRVLNFTEGSIIVDYALTFVQNSNQSVSSVNETLYEELQNPNGSFSGNYTFDESSLVVAPLDECEKEIDDCDINANCIDLGEDGYTCECKEGFTEPPGSLDGRECVEATEPPPTKPLTTEPPEEPGMVVWKVVVGVTVPIISILTITIVGLICWQYRRFDRTSPTSSLTKMRTMQYEEDRDWDREATRPGSTMIMNNNGTVQEVVLPWRDVPPESEYIFAPDKADKGRNQMLPMIDYPNDSVGHALYDDDDPLGNIVGSYDNYTYQHHDTRNTTEIDSKYF